MRSPLLLLAAAAFIRVSGLLFDVLNIDEVDFALIGRSVGEGHLPYAQLVDIKPPLTYIAFAPAALFGGLSLWPMHVLGILVTVATALLLGRAALRWTRDPVAAAAAPWLYLLATLCDVPSVNAELLLNLPTAAALLCFVIAESGSLQLDLLCGVCIGLASLFKHQGGMPLASLGLVLLIRAARTRTWRPILRGATMTVGLLLPWAITFAVYAGAGHLAELWDWCFARNFGYVGGAGTTEPALPRFVLATLTCVGGTLAAWILAVRETARRSPEAPEPTRTALLAGLWLTWIPVAMGARFYEHYYLQFAPFLALVGAPRAACWVRSWPTLPRRSKVRAGIATLVPVAAACAFFLVKGVVHGYQAQDPKLREVARFLRDQTRPEEELFVWGHTSPLYYLADRRPGTRYFHCSVHVGNFDPGHLPEGFDARRYVSTRDVEATLHDLEAHRVALFADLAPAAIHHWDKLPLSTVPALEDYLRAHYELIGTPAGARVYRRRD
jgi:4-amino-4-deoxy-L-arabinose transferase-like glycosyltransferase